MVALLEQNGPWTACLAALPGELNGLRRQITVEASSNRLGMRCYLGRLGKKNILLAQTGMGPEAAERAARAILEHYPLTALISFGFAGGLSPHLEAGDLVICKRLYRESLRENEEVVCSDAGLLAVAQARQSYAKALILGSSLTVGRLVSQPVEKRALAERYPVEILEMESYWIGLACSRRGVPFLAVRAVSDTVGQSLPPLERFLDPAGRARWLAALAYFISHPAVMVQLGQFSATTRAAERQLTRFMIAFLQSESGR